MTVHDGVDRAARILTDAGFPPEGARRDAAVLARFALGWTMAEWASRLREEAPRSFLDELAPLATRRSRHEPIAYITGTREFYGRPFHVTPSVLIPRPETEGIIDETLQAFPEDSSPVIVDIGTGSGCIAITLALELPGARIVGTDVSGATLELARTNAATLGATATEFVHVDASHYWPEGLPPANVIVSNPPYVPESDRALLEPDVRDFEPAIALFAGEDGLDVIRGLVPAVSRALAPGGILVMEIGAGQADAVSGIVARSGLSLLKITPDLQGIPRIVVARRV